MEVFEQQVAQELYDSGESGEGEEEGQALWIGLGLSQYEIVNLRDLHWSRYSR